jgi:cytochrome c oxidase cbb3-type subunit 3
MSLRFRCEVAVIAVLLTTGCYHASSSAGGSSTFPDATNVGPVPGGANVVNARIDPYLKDAVALREGKRLFGWYNCAGCHGIHGGGGMGAESTR